MRTKAKAESAALHAGLRKEQMKVESLERALQQKVMRPPCLLSTSSAGFCSEFPVCCPEHPVGAGGVLQIFGPESVLWVWFFGYFFLFACFVCGLSFGVFVVVVVVV